MENGKKQQCAKHGVFTGNTGCPWCREEAPVKPAGAQEGIPIMSSAGTGQSGARIVSKQTSRDVPQIETRIVGADDMAKTKRLQDDSAN